MRQNHRSPRPPVVERVAGWSIAHRKTAVLGWLALVVVVFAIGAQASASTVASYDPGQSGQAEQTLDQLHIPGPPPAEGVLVEAKGAAGRAQVRQAASQVASRLQALPDATASAVSAPRWSADGRAALVSFNVTGADEDTAVGPALKAVAALQASHPGLLITEAGDASISRTADQQLSGDFRRAEETSLPVTLVLLLAVFGALVAAGIPLLLAGTAVISAISLSSVLGKWLPTGQSTSEVILVLGMAVGVDYALFYLRRQREERAAGATADQALRTAARTSGRAIVVSGLTVMTALAGLFLSGWSVFTGVAIGTMVVVGVAVAGSLTFLPALLSWLGKRADGGKVPFLGRRAAVSRPSRLWGALARRVVRRPFVYGGVAAAAMAALAVPALGLHLANPPDDGYAGNAPVVRAQAAISREFPQAPSPALVVVTGRGLASPAASKAVTALQRDATPGGLVRAPVTATSAAGGKALVVSVPLAGDGSDAVSGAAVTTLRDKVLPATLGKVAGLHYAVGGDPAENRDDVAVLDARTPVVLGVTALLAFGLLLAAFSSPAIALLSVLLNLLSAAASFGLLTLIFGGNRLEGVLSYTGYGAVVPWVPLFMFVFLFGISMDYHVFILSRIRERRAAGRDAATAVVEGVAGTAGVVTSAAVIMVAVFAVLATLSFLQLKQLGVGLGAAVLLDATVVRGVLLPAVLAALGDRAWNRPRWLPRRAARTLPAPVAPAPVVAVPARQQANR